MICKTHKIFHFLFFILISLCSTSIAHNKTYNENKFLCANGTKIHTPTNHWAERFVDTKDVQLEPATGLSGRLYHPKFARIPLGRLLNLPVVIYFHGGAAFCSGSAFSSPYHNYSLTLAARALVVVLSVEYRSAPAFPIRVGYEDSWAALKWVANNSKWFPGHEPWLMSLTGLSRVFLAGDGVGANIAHNIGIRVGLENIPGLNVTGIILIHPLLWGENLKSENGWGERSYRTIFYGKEWREKQWVSQLWRFVSPHSSGLNDPNVNPVMDSNLSRMGSKRVMVFIARDDPGAKANDRYVAALRGSGWKGVVETLETKGKENGFYLDPKYANSTEAVDMMNKVVSFISNSRKN